jgi:hypothetical protein
MNKILQLALIVLLLFPFVDANAETYYLSPSGSDSNSGTSTGQAWATLDHAEDVMGAGDMLLIMGGVYTAPQHWERYGGSGGTPGNPIVFKAYGDSKAIFEHTGGPTRHSRRFWAFHDGADHVVIDGFSYLNPADSTIYLRLEGREDASFVIYFAGESDGSDWAEHITIRGVEIDGNFTPPGATYTIGGEMRYAIGFDWGRIDTIQACNISYVYHPTGDVFPGDGTDRAQGTGEAIYLETCELFYIADNYFFNANHALIAIHEQVGAARPSRYVKIVNNHCINYWGGGIYLSDATNHSLVDGNKVFHVGETTTKTKGAFFVGGNRNVVRRNVSYTPRHPAIGLKAQGWSGICRPSDSSMVYNNTFFGAMGNSIEFMARNEGSWSHPDASNTYNTLANNILYKSHGETPDIPFTSEIKLYLYDANAEHNWIEPDVAGTLPSSTHFGHNSFLNNCIRKDNHEQYAGEVIGYKEDADFCGSSCNIAWSVAEVQALDPIAWSGNIDLDPMLVSENPDAYEDVWWHLQNNSPCIDAGTVVNDVIGAYVNSLYPGYGWGNITYRGNAPNIGAYESLGEAPAPVIAPTQNRLMPPELAD